MPEIRVNGTTLSYTQAGHGETMVLLHSSASSKQQWQAMSQHLHDRFSVLAVDLYGYGGTDPWRGPGQPALADEAALISALLERCDERVHLVGHSYGGAVALRVATHEPHRLESLTLIEPVAFHLLRGAGPVEFELSREVAELSEGISASAHGGLEDGMARFIDFWNEPGTWANMRPDQRAKIAAQATTVAKDFHATLTEPSPPAAYSWIPTPTRILCGERSPLVAYAIADLLERLMPKARLEIVADAGHMMPMTHPGAVAAAIGRALPTRFAAERMAA